MFDFFFPALFSAACFVNKRLCCKFLEKAGLLARYSESLTLGAGDILRHDPSRAIREENPEVPTPVFVPGEGSARSAPALGMTGELAADQQLQPQSASRSSGSQTHV